MMDFRPLSALKNLDGYRRLYADLSFWAPYAQEVCRRHDLHPSAPARIGIPGTCPAVIIADRWVVKFFGRLFEGGHSYQVEQEAARLVKDALGIPIARVRASGHLAPHADWPWPYLVFDFIPGDSLGEQWAQVSSADRMRIARELGQAVRRLHAISTAGSPVFCPTTQDYQTLLVNQRAGCADRHRAWGHLPAHLIDQIDRYLPPIETLLEDQTPHLIHADLTRDHLLGRVTDGAWRTLAIIDFGDAMTGSLLYELGALHLDLFQADRAMLSAFLSAYGLPAAAYPALPARALATALLHRFDLFAGLPPAALDVPSLEDLAQALWRAGGY